MPESSLEDFERVFLPLMDDAYTLARHLSGSEHDAQDIVQEAYLRAWRYFGAFDGGDGRAWLLAIVRNCGRTWRRPNRVEHHAVEYVDDEHGTVNGDRFAADAAALAESDRRALERALAELSVEFREVIVLREIEELSYKEIARVVGAPIGTVMSRLARARERLQRTLRMIA